MLNVSVSIGAVGLIRILHLFFHFGIVMQCLSGYHDSLTHSNGTILWACLGLRYEA